MFFCIFDKVDNLFLRQSYLKRQLPVKKLDKKCKNNFLSLKKLKNTKSAQLCSVLLLDALNTVAS